MIFSHLRSLRFTIFLLITLTSVFILGVIIPQKDLLGREMYLMWQAQKPELVSFLESIGFTEIYTSPITLALWGLFFLNLIFVMSNRIPSIWRRTLRKDVLQSVDSIKGGKYYEVIEGKSIDDVSVAVRKMGYRVYSGGNSFWAVKNRFSPLATILFHLSFFLLLMGGVTSFYTKFRAEANVAVGETFTGQYQWGRPPKIGSIPKTTFMVEDIKPTYYKKDIPIDLKVVLLTEKGRKLIGINRPYNEGSLSFVIKDIDMAPLFIINDSEGNEVDGAFVKLRVLNGNEDSFRMAGYEFRTIFYTDLFAGLNTRLDGTASLPQALKQTPMAPEQTQHKEVVNPAFRMGVFKNGELIGSNTMRIGESLKFDGYNLVFSDLTYWVKFYVVKEHGLGIIYTGFTLMVLALIIRFLFYRRDIKGVIEQGRLHISGRGEFYHALFEDEFKELVNDLNSWCSRNL